MKFHNQFLQESLELVTTSSPRRAKKKDVWKFWRQNKVILSQFAILASFQAKSDEILSRTFLTYIDGKQQKNDQKWCRACLCAKPSHFDLIFSWPSFMSNDHKSTNKRIGSFRRIIKSFWVSLQVFVPKVMKFWPDHF